MVTLELTEQEANILIQLLDIAVKAEGLKAAEASLFFTNKIKSKFSDNEDNAIAAKIPKQEVVKDNNHKDVVDKKG